MCCKGGRKTLKFRCTLHKRKKNEIKSENASNKILRLDSPLGHLYKYYFDSLNYSRGEKKILENNNFFFLTWALDYARLFIIITYVPESFSKYSISRIRRISQLRITIITNRRRCRLDNVHTAYIWPLLLFVLIYRGTSDILYCNIYNVLVIVVAIL